MRDASQLPQPSIVDVDPEDPSQLLDEAGQYSVSELGVEAQPHAEADADLEQATATSAGDEAEAQDSEYGEDVVELDTPSETTSDAYAEAADDTGEAYGVHTPPAEDKDLGIDDEREYFADSELGENWLETLEKKATEGGAAAEHELDVVDNSDTERHHSSDTRDRPVADSGSGGEGGL